VKANVIMAKNLNDVPLSKKGVNNSFTKKAESVYDNVYQIVHCNYVPLVNLVKRTVNTFSPQLSNPYIESPGKPPNSAC
jgi:hypothetical protein